MKTTSRRNILLGATAAMAVAGMPAAVDAKTQEALGLFQQLNPERQEISLMAMRMFLDVQRHNESLGIMHEPERPDFSRRAGQ